MKMRELQVRNAIKQLADHRDGDWQEDGSINPAALRVTPACDAAELASYNLKNPRRRIPSFRAEPRASPPAKRKPATDQEQAEAVALQVAAREAHRKASNDVRVATAELKNARGKLGSAISAWRAMHAATPLEVSRAFMAASAAERARHPEPVSNDHLMHVARALGNRGSIAAPFSRSYARGPGGQRSYPANMVGRVVGRDA